eukprot:TRINITY_DN15298_c0_g1_i1.p1 TRINITY_DN15298_c0_g1~~TRINITY_DN15298_c0_g1_i1.p1  ORF type:complete len:1312 (+),score=362.60 TRINITY_DN15298_c0_g1_i1:105-3938(+)
MVADSNRSDTTAGSSPTPPLSTGGMEELGRIYDDLVPLCTPLEPVLGGYQPPHIAVIGAESSGKSTVLEAISGVNCFPRGDDVVTRMKIVVRLRNKAAREDAVLCVKDSSGKIVRDPVVIGDTSRGYELVQKAMDQEVQEAMGRTRAKKKPFVTDRHIELQVSGPSFPCVDLVDLPGIITQPEEASEATRKVIKDHVLAHESTAYLVIVPGNTRPSNDVSLELVRSHRLEEKAIGVFTKCDLVAGKKERQELVGRVVSNVEDTHGGHRHLKHGWIATVCRHEDAEEEGLSVEAAERKFFAKEVFKTLMQPGGELAGREVLKRKAQELFCTLMLNEWVPKTKALLSAERDQIDFSNSVLGLPAADEVPDSERLRQLIAASAAEAFDGARPELQGVLRECCSALGAAVAAIPEGDEVTKKLTHRVEVDCFMEHADCLAKKLGEQCAAAVDSFCEHALDRIKCAFEKKETPSWKATAARQRKELIKSPPFVLLRFSNFLDFVMRELRQKVSSWGDGVKQAHRKMVETLFEPSSMQTRFTYHPSKGLVSMSWKDPEAVQGALIAEFLKHVVRQCDGALFSRILEWTRSAAESMSNEHLAESEECIRERERLRKDKANVEKAFEAVRRLKACARSIQGAGPAGSPGAGEESDEFDEVHSDVPDEELSMHAAGKMQDAPKVQVVEAQDGMKSLKPDLAEGPQKKEDEAGGAKAQKTDDQADGAKKEDDGAKKKKGRASGSKKQQDKADRVTNQGDKAEEQADGAEKKEDGATKKEGQADGAKKEEGLADGAEENIDKAGGVKDKEDKAEGAKKKADKVGGASKEGQSGGAKKMEDQADGAKKREGQVDGAKKKEDEAAAKQDKEKSRGEVKQGDKGQQDGLEAADVELPKDEADGGPTMSYPAASDRIFVGVPIDWMPEHVGPHGTQYIVCGTLPEGVHLDQSSGRLSGAAVRPGDCAVTVRCGEDSCAVRFAVGNWTIKTVAGHGGKEKLQPYDIAVDSSAYFYASVAHPNRILRIYPDGLNAVVAGKAGGGGSLADNIEAEKARLAGDNCLALDRERRKLYLTDGPRVRCIDLVFGMIQTLPGCDDLGKPAGMVVHDGALYVACYGSGTVEKVELETGARCTVAGTTSQDGGGDGPATLAKLEGPSSVAVCEGGLYIVEYHGERVRRVDLETGTISTVAGGGKTAALPCPATEAELRMPWALVSAEDGRLYMTHENRVLLLRGGNLCHVAGSDSAGFSGEEGPAATAKLNSPGGIAEFGGSLYVADWGNNRVRVLRPSGLQ